MTDEDIAHLLNMNPQVVKFYLQELEKSKMVGCVLYVGSPREWYLAQEGRRYLIENRLIS